jgi:hypothetical protein
MKSGFHKKIEDLLNKDKLTIKLECDRMKIEIEKLDNKNQDMKHIIKTSSNTVKMRQIAEQIKQIK